MINMHQNLPKHFFLSFAGSCLNQMQSFVLPSQYHHLESLSLNWFSTYVTTLQPYEVIHNKHMNIYETN